MHDQCNCESHTYQTLSQWHSLQGILISRKTGPTLDGHSLDIATVIAVARHKITARLSEAALRDVAASAELLKSNLEEGVVIYGVNTGFGGSADTRTKEMEELQTTLIRELHSGIMSNTELRESSCSDPWLGEIADLIACMPESWVRASMLIRMNSLISGYSGVRPIILEKMLELLREDVIPRIPLRGSISASGDLMPLSYIGGAIEGKRSVTVWTGSRPNRRTTSADVALAELSIGPVRLGPKEGLAIINGTAVSSGVAALAVHDANNLAALSQLLTAMSVEALKGTDESFDPFLAKVRPHSGQIEAARNIRAFLFGSRLVHQNDGSGSGTLRQDRYSIRTASQWLGPVLEDLQLASQQISIECNSVTDNPLVDPSLTNDGKARVIHGGNFQAKVITSAMEKVRLSVQTIGQMLFAQCTEIINPRLNYGLPPNLIVDEPSKSFLLKPVDIMIAALQSELGFLANPAGTHVQSAEMGNQALNSLGLISARYTHTALDVLSQLAATHLFTLCQALDLRAMHSEFLESARPTLRNISVKIFDNLLHHNLALDGNCEIPSSRVYPEDSMGDDQDICERRDSKSSAHEDLHASLTHHESCLAQMQLGSPISSVQNDDSAVACRIESLHTLIWEEFKKQLDQTVSMDSKERFDTIFQHLQPLLIDFEFPSSSQVLPEIRRWTQQCSDSTLAIFLQNRDTYHANADATPFLGMAARHLYAFVRKDLGVPFLRTSMIRGEGHRSTGPAAEADLRNQDGPGEDRTHMVDSDLTTGALITKIYQSIRAGGLIVPLMECFDQIEHATKT